MATPYNNYFPASYQPIQQPVMQAYPTYQNQGITWVQGESGAKAQFVAAGQSALLMDSDASCFYIKSADASGMPLPLRIFDYTERKQPQPGQHQDESRQLANELSESLKDYITRDEFDLKISEILQATGKKATKKEKDNE